MQIQQLQEYQKKQHPLLMLDCETPLIEAIRSMDAHGYGSAICTRDGRYHGMFTTRLLLNKIAANENIASLRLADVVRTDGPVAALDDSAKDKLQEMEEAHVHYMPIVDKEGYCRGLISQGDFTAYTLEQATARFAETIKEKAENKTNPPGMIIVMALYMLVLIGIGAVIF